MQYYAVIHAVCGLFEGYSDTSCDWFPTKEAADKHVKQMCDTYREDEMCVNIDHHADSIYVNVWNDDMSEAHEMRLHDTEIGWWASKYDKGLVN